MDSSDRWSASGRWGANRALGTAIAAIIMVVVIAVVGAGAYFAFNGVNGNGSSSSGSSKGGGTTGGGGHTFTCEPANSPVCQNASGGHDLYLTVPFTSSAAGTNMQFTATYVSGSASSVSYYLFNFGDGSAVVNQTTTQAYHVYPNAGTYIASVQAAVKGSTSLHDSFEKLLVVSVTPNTGGINQLETPRVSASLVSNSSSTSSPTGVLSDVSQFVEVNGTYTAAPTDPLSTPLAPSIVASTGGTLSSTSAGSSFAQAKATFDSPGTHTVTFVGGGQTSSGTYYQNYTWSVFVAPSGFHAGYIAGGTPAGGGPSSLRSQHPGTLQVYELAPGGSYSEDPAYDYETVGYEPIINVYQSLITYNGSATGSVPGDFVPELATCVPGSTLCQSQYGAGFTGVDGYNFTFVLNKDARFYDPTNGNSWGVYPSDVVFSLARTMGFSTGIAFGATNGWVVTQSLLSSGNGAWDSLHGVVNNTPQNVFAAMSVNDSSWCPASAMSSENGCVTFHVNANGVNWPYFLELIGFGLGSSIVPCGWFSESPQSAGIPMWTNNGSTANQGDHPCTLPGGATSTNSSAFTTAVAAMNPKGWDQWEVAGAGGASAGQYVGNVQWNLAGSGPYFMKSIIPGSSYTLQANPAYTAPCSWTGCEPEPGTYAKSVQVTWETSAAPGELAYKAGVADLASVPLPDLSFLLSLVNAGTVSLLSFPSISIYFFPMDLNFNTAKAKTITPTENVDSNFLSPVAMREFLANSYPYATVQNTINVRNGLTFFNNYGGAIPNTMQFNQPTIAWPSGDPTGSSSTPGTAQWWWTQATTSSSPQYDPLIAKDGCKSTSPCYIPFMGETGAPDVDQRITAFEGEVKSISGGAIQFAQTDINFGQLVGYSTSSAPGNNPMGLFQLGWAPDYPDPTDYVTPMYVQDSTYTYSDAVLEQLTNQTQGFDSSSCHSNTDYGYWAGQANNYSIPENCQGSAYVAMQDAMHLAASETSTSQRNTLYFDAESIANGLALYVYWGQQNLVESAASYINTNSLNSNVTIGGGQDNTWFTVTYAATGNGVSD